MTTATPEGPVAKTRPPMSEEHKAKLAAGRARALAEKAAVAAMKASPATITASTVPDLAKLQEQLAAANAENERLRKHAGLLTPDEIAALPAFECYYEFVADKRTDRDEPIGEKIKSIDDPRFAELVALRRPIIGQVIVEKIFRAVSGEEIRRSTDAGEGGSCIGVKSPIQAKDLMKTWHTNRHDFHAVRAS